MGEMYQVVIAWFALAAGGMTLYYGAVISGMYKNSLMDYFRHYGEDRPISPLFRFLVVAGLLCICLMLLVSELVDPRSYLYRVFPPSVFTMLALMAFGAAFLVRRQPVLRESLPRWYSDLMHLATRQERRQIAFAWLRISWRLRWRLNGDQASFYVWAELVRLTVIYGAYDPDNPWSRWT